MANPLTLVIPLKAGADIEELLGAITAQKPQIDGALARVGTVHFARFVLLDASAPNLLPTPGSKGPFALQVITTYDGDFDVYIQAFVNILGPVFDLLLTFSADGQALIPVKDHVAEFQAYIKGNDASAQPGAFELISTYPYTVQQILGEPAVVTLDYADIQGTVLQGYRVDHARHFVLEVSDPAGARGLLGALVDPDSGMPQITTAERWRAKPTSFLNVGITAAGLEALGQPTGGFPAAFRRGATSPDTSALVGDVGASAPQRWIDGWSDGTRVQVILSLWVHRDLEALEHVSATLRTAFAGAMTELAAQDATALPDNQVHFGYSDNISQPTVEGGPPPKRALPDQQPVAPAGEFLLGHPNQNGSTYRVTPEPLSTNSSFAAFRLLEQDVAGFEAWLALAAPRADIDVEMLAAKVCGRWRNGVPLVLSPTSPTPDPPLDPGRFNDFTYVPGDTYGYACPVGSHMRRSNPRNELVLAGGSEHRIIRRAMPYGPPFDPQRPDDRPRGLVGWFINADIANQFELIMSQWVNGSTFVMSPPPLAPPARGPNPVNNISGGDVLLGANDPASSSFTLSDEAEGNQRLTGFGPFVTTRGAAYCYLPSISAIRFLAQADQPG